jgi:decaprenyl-phosphate phosphoribosyltransferase
MGLMQYEGGKLLDIIKLMRPKQWIKNFFILAPLIFSGLFTDPTSLKNAVFAMFLFCIASSATYILNDASDIEKDRLHPKKSKTRPLASGAVSLRTAYILMGFLYSLLAIAFFFIPEVVGIIIIYMALNLAYTFKLKHEPVLDIFTIALGFVLRVITGSIAINVPISSWMLISTLCLALYLAAVKRRQELHQMGTEARSVLQKYTLKLIDRYAEMSATSALIFYSMYVMSTRPELAISIPLVIFGLYRYWYVVDALSGGESPTDALTADWQLLATVITWTGICIWVLSRV